MQPNVTPKEAREFEGWGVPPPSTQPHGTDQDIARNLTKLQPKSWRLEGNKLIGMTDWGELVQYIPTNYVCTGTDDKGLPMFRKLTVN